MGIYLGSKEEETCCDGKTDATSPKPTPMREERGTPVPGASPCSRPRPRRPGDLCWLCPLHLHPSLLLRKQGRRF